jgi:rhodanese-related sulfurtransferase
MLFFIVPEVEEAFLKDDEDFLAAYGFSKPAKNATNVVIGCRSGRRAVTANEKLQSLGYSSFK